AAGGTGRSALRWFERSWYRLRGVPSHALLRATLSTSLLLLIVADATLLRAGPPYGTLAVVVEDPGQATEQDYQKAKEGYEKAAAAGNAKAMANLGYM